MLDSEITSVALLLKDDVLPLTLTLMFRGQLAEPRLEGRISCGREET